MPPTLENVSVYCQENGYEINAQKFIDFYTSKGWMIGKNKMQDWKAAVRNWSRQERKESEKAANKSKPASQNRFNNFHQRDYDFTEYERQLLNR